MPESRDAPHFCVYAATSIAPLSPPLDFARRSSLRSYLWATPHVAQSNYVVLAEQRTLVTVALSSAVGAALALFAAARLAAPRKPGPNPASPYNEQFAAIGRAYLPQLGKSYAAAWEEGAKQLDAGGGISAALDTVSKTWSANRTKLYDHVLTPEFSKIVAESVNDADLTAAERSAMAAAWRGLSLGLRK